jgi:uncharacterized protein (DUF1330 family)
VLAVGPATVIEGPSIPNHNVVIEFPDEATALKWFESEEYQEVRPIRLEAAASSQLSLVKAWSDR